jgi:hypothetical protein
LSFWQVLRNFANSNLRAFDYSGIWYLLTTDFTNPRLREDKFRSKFETAIPAPACARVTFLLEDKLCAFCAYSDRQCLNKQVAREE